MKRKRQMKRPIELGADHKVVIVLDHGPRLGVEASEKLPIHVKELTGNKQKLAATVSKTVWSLAVECALEMHRCVGDIFPNDNKLMRFVLSDCVGRFLTSETSDAMKQWTDKLISRHELYESIKSAGKPLTSEDSSILNGVRMAVDALTEKTTAYRKAVEAAQRGENQLGQGKRARIPIPLRGGGNAEANKQKREQPLHKPVENRGAIVLMTALESEEELKSLEADIVEIVKGRNMIVKNLGDDNFSPIDDLRCYIINVHSEQQENPISSKPMRVVDASELVKIQLLSSVDNGEALRMAVHGATLDLYDLVSTTIAGIPMKEESIAGQSVNYDVELFCPRAVFGELEKHDLLAPSSHLISNNGVYSTVKLQWSTPNPKNKWDLFPRTSTTARISLANFNARQSVCLSSFLMNGRNVMLEVSQQGVAAALPPNVGNKLISHTLIASSGLVIIHQMVISKQEVLDNEDLQKRAQMKPIPGFRINDFKNLMKESTLSVKNIEKKTEKEKEKMPNTSTKTSQPYQLLNRITRFWPLHQDQTVIYNVQEKFEKLFDVLRKPELSAEDFEFAKGVIMDFVAKKDNPPVANDENDVKTAKTLTNRAEQFQTVAQELALHFGNYVNHSEQHLELFNQLIQLTTIERTLSIPTNDVSSDEKRESIQSVSQAIKWYGGGGGGGASTPSRTSSRSNSPQPKRAYKDKYLWKPGETLKLGTWFLQQDQTKYWSRWKDFEGRIQAGDQPAKLYPDLDIPPNSNKKTEIPQG